MNTQNNDKKQQISPQPTQDHIDKAMYWFVMRPQNVSHQIDSLAQLISDSEAQLREQVRVLREALELITNQADACKAFCDTFTPDSRIKALAALDATKEASK